jgi:hypothetical protein
VICTSSSASASSSANASCLAWTRPGANFLAAELGAPAAEPGREGTYLLPLMPKGSMNMHQVSVCGPVVGTEAGIGVSGQYNMSSSCCEACSTIATAAERQKACAEICQGSSSNTEIHSASQRATQIRRCDYPSKGPSTTRPLWDSVGD